MTIKRLMSPSNWKRGVNACAALLVTGCVAQAAVTFTADPAVLPLPTEADVYTFNPYVDAASNGGAGVAVTTEQGQRNLRQTFKLGQDINVGQIIFSLVGGQQSAGLQLRIYEVDDVLSNWNPGALVHQSIFESTVVDSTNWLQIDFTEGNIFSLPARNAGTTGYGIEFSENSGVLGNSVGELRYNTDATDYYADGRYLFADGSAPSVRDIGLIIVGTDELPPLLGDVDGINGVDLTDLQIIADHFRQPVTMRSQGDLTSDFFVDFRDFDQWKKNYTGPTEGIDFGFLSAPVPEPGSATLAMIGLAAASVAARRRRRSASVEVATSQASER
ncbi:hypothetical protein Pla175_31670 [Pirellulimonas nuda]|uniref:Ice-binding protein C-terminal domain-containing protein n=1 Tax=Pirellulimonas nuda TaxID=2528009 RepID=A0A518DEB8_9BACT|nr:PEP-CTERM sorting domain-containing protein [Pirellulimonas nuda]QDU89772.1 hypothetical protein Pla175_31670 [Pirellulimonas nuda]